IAFTGSTEVGKTITERSIGNLKSLTLELGGKSPNIILPDADLSSAVPGAYAGIMANQGQACAAGSRLFIHKSQYDEFISEFSKYINKTRVGSGMDSTTEMGPLVSKRQQKRVLSYIESGVSAGAKIAAEGKVPNSKGYYVKPTIFSDVDGKMKIAQEEI